MLLVCVYVLACLRACLLACLLACVLACACVSRKGVVYSDPKVKYTRYSWG